MKLDLLAAALLLLLVGNTGQVSSVRSPEKISFLKKLRLLQGRPLGLDFCLCPTIYRPVCGSDQETYSNACAARCQTKVSLYSTHCIKVSILVQKVDFFSNQRIWFFAPKKLFFADFLEKYCPFFSAKIEIKNGLKVVLHTATIYHFWYKNIFFVKKAWILAPKLK